MRTLEERLGYRFKNIALLENALTHSSYANEHRWKKLESNERLEFLGDAVLGMVVADHLFRNYPHVPEGELTRLRASLVCEGSLVVVAQGLELGSYLKLGRGEELGGGHTRPSILADAVESVLAAVYLDGGLTAATGIIKKFILEQSIQVSQGTHDYKTALQELVQRKNGQELSYRLASESGPDHAKQFSMEVLLNGEVVGSGTGHSKKEAEQNAARGALELLQKRR